MLILYFWILYKLIWYACIVFAFKNWFRHELNLHFHCNTDNIMAHIYIYILIYLQDDKYLSSFQFIAITKNAAINISWCLLMLKWKTPSSTVLSQHHDPHKDTQLSIKTVLLLHISQKNILSICISLIILFLSSTTASSQVSKHLTKFSHTGIGSVLWATISKEYV